jgi:hypothetical protein
VTTSKTLVRARRPFVRIGAVLGIGAALAWICLKTVVTTSDAPAAPQVYSPRKYVDTSGFALIVNNVTTWSPTASLHEIADCCTPPGET